MARVVYERPAGSAVPRGLDDGMVTAEGWTHSDFAEVVKGRVESDLNSDSKRKGLVLAPVHDSERAVRVPSGQARKSAVVPPVATVPSCL